MINLEKKKKKKYYQDMSCSHPSLAVDFGVNPETGKRIIKFLNTKRLGGHWSDFQSYKETYGDKLLALPCGKCEGCILARRKMWSFRCYAESLYFDQNSFITLTYDDKHLPSKLIKSDLQKFIRNLRKSCSFRYFGCGEYGGFTGRPHYHLILFGFMPNDLKYFSMSKSGFRQYTSELVSSCWNKGFVTVSEFTPETAAYTAGYVDKKYKQDDCFILMSTKPGLGARYFLDHKEDIYKNDVIVGKNGYLFHVPAYFDKLAEKLGLNIEDVKENRLNQMNYLMYKSCRDLETIHYEDVLRFNEGVFKDKLERKKRGL